MRILTRYVLKEFLVPFAYCLTGFVSIYVLFDLFGSFSRMMNAHISLADAALYFCAYLAPYFHYIVPAALMLATLYTMWSFCRHSEIIAMRASGISFLTIVKPLLAVSIVMAGLVAWIYEDYVPRKAQWAQQMKTVQFDLKRIVHADNIVYRNAKAGRTWNVDKMLDAEGNHLSNLKVSVDRPNGGMRLMNVTAEKADYLDGEWWLTNAKVQHFDAQGREVATPTPELDSMPLRCFEMFDERPEDFILQNRPWKYYSVRDRFRYLKTHTGLSKEARSECVYDTWALLMAPWACVIITLFAIPAGIASGRQSVFKGILGALGMFFAFFGFTIGCLVASGMGWCPPVLAAVLPNVVFLALGIRAFFKQR